jgi:hypothetical protein
MYVRTVKARKIFGEATIEELDAHLGPVLAVRSFYNGPISTLRSLRADSRAKVRAPPPYPADTERMVQLLLEMSGKH